MISAKHFFILVLWGNQVIASHSAVLAKAHSTSDIPTVQSLSTSAKSARSSSRPTTPRNSTISDSPTGKENYLSDARSCNSSDHSSGPLSVKSRSRVNSDASAQSNESAHNYRDRCSSPPLETTANKPKTPTTSSGSFVSGWRRSVNVGKIGQSESFNEIRIKLAQAVKAGNLADLIETIDLCDDASGDKYKLERMGHTPLYSATSGGNLDCVKAVVRASAYVPAEVYYGPILGAVNNGFEEIALYLIKRVKNSHGKMPFVGTSLLYDSAIRNHLPSVVRELTKNSIFLPPSTERDVLGNTPLITAIIFNETESALHLIHGIPPMIKYVGDQGLTPLHHAAKHNNLEVARALIEHRCDVAAEDIFGMKPLHYAALSGSADMCLLFILSGANVRDKSENGETVLHCAAQSSSQQCIDLCLTNGLKLDDQDFMGYTALHHAAKGRSPSQLHYLIVSKGMSPNLQTSQERLTPLMIAARADNSLAVDCLITLKADVKLRDAEGRFALHFAATKDIFDKLVLAGSDMNSQDDAGLTPLHRACSNDDEELAEHMINLDRNPNIKDNNGQTALHKAVQAGSEKIVKLLMRKGCKSNIVDHFGQTAIFSLFSAECSKLPSKVKKKLLSLLLKDADPSAIRAKDHSGKNFLYYALAQGDERLVREAVVIHSADLHAPIREGDHEKSLLELVSAGAFDKVDVNKFTAINMRCEYEKSKINSQP